MQKSEMVNVIIEALWSVRGECTEHTKRRITKTHCERCTAEIIVEHLDRKGMYLGI